MKKILALILAALFASTAVHATEDVITLGDVIDTSKDEHYVMLDSCKTKLTEEEFNSFYSEVKDVPLQMYIKGGNMTGIPKLDFDNLDIGGRFKGIPYGNSYYKIKESDDYQKLSYWICYLLYFGDNAENKLNISEWAYNEVKAAAKYDIIPYSSFRLYVGNTSFKEETTTRREFCMFAKRLIKKVKPEILTDKSYRTHKSTEFSDLKSNPDDILPLPSLGIITGYEDGTLRPKNPITREEAAVMITRILALFDMTDNTKTAYADEDKIQVWARDAVNTVAAYGIMNGTGYNLFSPQGNYTVEQTAVTMLRSYNYMKQQQ